LLVYSARLYPQRVGNLSIDSYGARIKFPVSKNNSGWGAQYAQEETRDIYSPRLQIEVISLPSDNVPPDFTGLVGEHQFSLLGANIKNQTNEPIEFQLVVQGPGELETYNGPKLYVSSDLEEFDNKSETQEVNQRDLKKIFDYTYLARNPLQLPKKEVTFSCFDPVAGKYKTKKIMLPELSITSTSASSSVKTEKKNEIESDDIKKKNKPSIALERKLYAPVFYKNSKNHSLMDFFNYLLGLVFIAIAVSLYKSKPRPSGYAEVKDLANQLRKEGPNYSKFYKLVNKIVRSEGGGDTSARLTIDMIKSLELSSEAKEYFIKYLQAAEENFYHKRQTLLRHEIKYFSQMLKLIKKDSTSEKSQ
jgi:hypothetical protein